MDYFKSWSMFEKVWLVVSVSLLIIASYLWKSPWYGFVASITGMVCVVLAAKGRIGTYYWGIVNCIFYAYTAYTWKLYGEVMLNAMYFLPMQFYGMYIWGINTNAHIKSVRVKFLTPSMRLYIAGISLCLVLLYNLILKKLGGNITMIDSMSTVLSVIAMILMARRYMEQWILWIIVDVVSVIMWFIVVFKQGSNDIGVLIMWSAYLINAIYGYYNWRKLHKIRSYAYVTA